MGVRRGPNPVNVKTDRCSNDKNLGISQRIRIKTSKIAVLTGETATTAATTATAAVTATATAATAAAAAAAAAAATTAAAAAATTTAAAAATTTTVAAAATTTATTTTTTTATRDVNRGIHRFQQKANWLMKTHVSRFFVGGTSARPNGNE
jgi:hypothetical protein